MAEITGDLIYDDSVISKTKLVEKAMLESAAALDKVIKVSTGVSSAVKTNTNSFADLAAEQKKLSAAQSQYVVIQDKVQKETKQATKEIDKQNDALSKQNKQFNTVKDSVQQLAPGLAGMAQGFMASAKAALAFIATPIGAVLAVLAGLILSVTKYLQGSEEGQNKWNKVVAIGTQALEGLFDILEAVGGFIVDNFSKALNAGITVLDFFAKAITGNSKVISSYINELTANADKIANLEAQIEKNERNLIEKRAATNLRVAQLRRQADEENDPLTRRNLLVKAMKLEDDLLQMELKNQKNRITLAKTLVTENGDDIGALNKLTEERAKYAELQAKEINETRKNNKERIKLDKELYDEQLALIRDNLAKQRAAREGYKELTNNSLKDIAKDEVKTTQDANKLIEQGFIFLGKKKAEANHLTNQQIDKDNKKLFDSIKKNSIESINFVSDLYNIFAESRQAKDEAALSELELRKERELELAGDNEEAKAEIARKFDAEEKKLRMEKDKRERNQTIFNILLNTARAIVTALPNIPLSIAAGIIGAASLAAAISAPLPQYFKGTKDSEGGLAWIGERGTELVETPDGKKFLSPSSATLVDLPLHSKVLTHEETLNALAKNGGSRIPQLAEQQSENLGGKIDLLIKTVKNKKQFSLNITRNGVEMAMQNAQTRTWFLDNFYK